MRDVTVAVSPVKTGGNTLNIIKKTAIVALALAVTACAKQPQSIPFVQPAGKPIQVIGLVTPHMPDRAAALLATSPGKNAANAAAGAGLIGLAVGLVIAGIDAGMQSSRESTLEEMLKAESFNAPTTFSSALRTALEAKGYQVVDIPRSSQRNAGRTFQENYQAPAGQNVDAFLDILVEGYGYGAASSAASSPYRPTVYTEVRLVNADTKSVLMWDKVIYNPMGDVVRDDKVIIPPAPEFSFVDFDAVERAPQKVAEGLDVALVKTADTIGTLLR